MMSKIEATSKVPLKLPFRINLGGRGARERRAFDFGHSPQAPPHGLERANSPTNISKI